MTDEFSSKLWYDTFTPEIVRVMARTQRGLLKKAGFPAEALELTRALIKSTDFCFFLASLGHVMFHAYETHHWAVVRELTSKMR